MTRVVIAPDSFKGTITAADAVTALTVGWHSVDPSADICARPMADGGEGTLDAFAAVHPEAEYRTVTITGPDGFEIEALWLYLPPTPDAAHGTAVIDVASTVGIELLTELLPLDADTTGFGEAIAAALDEGVSRIIVGIGSSSSTDGGTGMLRALGARFIDAEGEETPSGARGLTDIVAVDMSQMRPAPEVLVLTDVTNALVGRRGAARVFGPQKGLSSAADIGRTDAALAKLARLLEVDARTPGSGAAGGLGAALLAWGGRLVPGAHEVAELIKLDAAVHDADIVITGEGSFDGQSGAGKVPAYVAEMAARAHVPVALVAGRITPDAHTDAFVATASLTELAGTADAAMNDAAHWLEQAGADLARRIGRAAGAYGT
ncbi:glycerate kinase [Microbacterium sp. YY-01]|uniref:glycerate kinase n=1 Tax=Microbacterium sp. YY-01 TaxID=3421634 RepID=UPI003D1661DF